MPYQEVAGRTFLDLTQQDLKRWRMPGELAKTILPNKSDLANFLNKNPPVKILLSPTHFFQFSTTSVDGITEKERNTYFILSREAECTLLYSRLLGQLIYPPSHGKTKESYHYLWDSVIKNTVETFGMYSYSANLLSLEFDRNTNKQTSAGEEKSGKNSGDLSSKLVNKIKDWIYGDAPYIFAYYAIGVAITFVTLYKPENKKRKLSICSEQIANFNLERLSDRICIMNFLRNICKCFLSFKLLLQNINSLYGYLSRLLPIIVKLCSSRESSEFQIMFQPDGTIIELEYAIRKKFAKEANYIRFSDKLEYASTHSVNLVPQAFSESNHVPKMLIKKHNFKVDIWGVENLVGSCNVRSIP
ncbi:hypothetical protein Glove_130g215 [Diversispora epigaea]|uniref:Uncharacterized protein n=1 Tax=Diversispora epigaea TaxID=1348612 RepID=A0A397J0R7_9GLOM|nr:hypothetical protein Glove_130g215 [Diversispora epigaea]